MKNKIYLALATLGIIGCLAGGTKVCAASAITIDGDFQDWASVEKTQVDNNGVESVAAVFNDEALYLYIQEQSKGSALWSGSEQIGHFTILTDTGRNTAFKLNKKSIKGIAGAKVKYSDCQYEISIPRYDVKAYKETISFGYYMEDTMLIDGIKNESSSNIDRTFQGIIYDGLYGDWNYYPHETFTTTNSKGKSTDVEAAIYSGEKYLFGHIKTNSTITKDKFDKIAIRVNGKDKNTLNLCLVGIGDDNSITMNPNLKKLSKGMHEFGLWDADSDFTATNDGDTTSQLYGKVFITVTSDGNEMEYKVNLEKLVDTFDMDKTNLKKIEAQYSDISGEWVMTERDNVEPMLSMGLCGITIAVILLIVGLTRMKMTS